MFSHVDITVALLVLFSATTFRSIKLTKASKGGSRSCAIMQILQLLLCSLGTSPIWRIYELFRPKKPLNSLVFSQLTKAANNLSFIETSALDGANVGTLLGITQKMHSRTFSPRFTKSCQTRHWKTKEVEIWVSEPENLSLLHQLILRSQLKENVVSKTDVQNFHYDFFRKKPVFLLILLDVFVSFKNEEAVRNPE